MSVDDEGRELLFQHVDSLIDYWGSVEGKSNVPPETPKKEALDGLAFSMLVMLDGSALTGGAWELRYVDEDGNASENIAGTLHELWSDRRREST